MKVLFLGYCVGQHVHRVNDFVLIHYDKKMMVNIGDEVCGLVDCGSRENLGHTKIYKIFVFSFELNLK